ncbi:MAG TPA: alpha/beta hydrolase-fold protein [Kofleriaceae bacterium]|jgi:predicted alpha/beta superfamily hydrolase
MKKLAIGSIHQQLLCLTCAALASACTTDAPSHDPPPVDEANGTPELEDATATIRVVYASQAITAGDVAITLRGEGSLVTETPCAPVDATTCEATVTQFPAGERELAFRPYRGGVPARGARYLVARDEKVEIAPHFTQTKGTLRELIPAFHSTVLNEVEPGNTRRIWAYLPASYSENAAKRYPVVYMHDGRNLFDPTLSITGIEWQVDESAERAWEETGEFAEVIVIGIDQFVTVNGTLGNYRQGDYNPTPDQGILNRPPTGTLYAQAIATELKPTIDGMLRTLPGASTTATLGSSLGATISVWLTHAHPSVFGRAAIMSPASGIGNDWIIDQLLTAPVLTLVAQRLAALYIDAGTSEPMLVATQYIDAYHTLGYVDGDTMSSLFELNGYHDENAWARRLPIALAALFPGRRIP